jgi:UDP-N-acetylglucosamine 1-carboxyvinyltransferase
MFVIHGGVPLRGAVTASGSKNAALPIMAASILADGPVLLRHVPRLADVQTLSRLLTELGVEVRRSRDGRMRLTNVDPTRIEADAKYVRRMRGSFCVLGPLLARRRKAVVPLPGGCAIGDRPIDLHLSGLAALGADLSIHADRCVAHARRLRGTNINLAGPRGPSVTGTANVMSAATLARGRTVILNAAREPEIVDLGNFLVALGARIEGLGASTIEIVGVESLASADHTLIPDRIEAATYLTAGAITGGAVTVDDVIPEHLTAVLDVLRAAGANVSVAGGSVSVEVPRELQAFDVAALPYPGFPTDVQAQLMALATVARGRSTIVDHVFPERFGHVSELQKLGAKIHRRGNGASVEGATSLRGARVIASDLRASAALVLAGLAATGRTTVHRLRHLDRGYESLEQKLRTLGAKIERVSSHSLSPCGRGPG